MFESVEAFYRPATVREALQLLHGGNGSARFVAGCTDVIVEGDNSVRLLIDITHAGLNYIRRRGNAWSIGATTTMTALEESAEIRALACGLLARAAAVCGPVEIRNVATLGGNLANGSPAADLAPPLLVLDAVAVIAGPHGRRRMPLPEYLAAARSRELADSLLVEVAFPDPPHGAHLGWSFHKFGRTAVDVAMVNVAAGLQLDGRGRVKWARIALGAVAPEPVRMPAAEAILTGHVFDRALLAEVCEAVMRDVRPISDLRASADYRRELARVLTGRALQDCVPQGCSI